MSWGRPPPRSSEWVVLMKGRANYRAGEDFAQYNRIYTVGRWWTRRMRVTLEVHREERMRRNGIFLQLTWAISVALVACAPPSSSGSPASGTDVRPGVSAPRAGRRTCWSSPCGGYQLVTYTSEQIPGPQNGGAARTAAAGTAPRTIGPSRRTATAWRSATGSATSPRWSE